VERVDIMARILLVDDDTTLTDYIGEYLVSLGYEVSSANDGAAALKAIEGNSPNCVLLDIDLKGELSGIDVLRQIKARGLDVKVIMITGYVESEKEDLCKELGASDYIVKPIKWPVLSGIIESVLK
jgi:DNA-binding response OmpR family regulator